MACAAPRAVRALGTSRKRAKYEQPTFGGSPALLRAYVDETGDRGYSGASSPFFAFAAVVISDEDKPQLQGAMSHLRRDLTVPTGKALHWKAHVKNFGHSQRAIARQLSIDRRIETIADLVGHASTAVTEEVYRHQLSR